MFRKLSLTALAVLVAQPVSATEFTIDVAHSSVGFKVAHMVVSKTRGSFQDFAGTIRLDENDLSNSSVEVTIDAASIYTANEERDDHLRSPDFFDAENSPTIRFKSGRIEKNGKGFIATGNLTIKGSTRLVELPFQLNGPITDPWGNQRIGVEIEPITIDRREFGLTWSKTIEAGGLMVGDEVTIELEVEAVELKQEPGA
jgi:polyisoprenoid-binding protein YceI